MHFYAVQNTNLRNFDSLLLCTPFLSLCLPSILNEFASTHDSSQLTSRKTNKYSANTITNDGSSPKTRKRMTYDNMTGGAAGPVATGAKIETSDIRSDSNQELFQDNLPDQTGGPNSESRDQDKLEFNVDPSSCPSSTSSSSADPSDATLSFNQEARSDLKCALNNNSTRQPSGLVASSIGLNKESSVPSTESDDSRVRESSSNILYKEVTPIVCYNPVLDDEIRGRLDKLNALSDLINSLELQFDQTNALFQETLKCSTERLSAIAKNLGTKSIRHGRMYHAAKISVEQTQSDCQKACVQFERANNDHQYAKQAIKEAESKLHEINNAHSDVQADCSQSPSNIIFDPIDISSLRLEEDVSPEGSKDSPDYKCDNPQDTSTSRRIGPDSSEDDSTQIEAKFMDADASRLINSAKLSEDLNRAVIKLIEAEEKRCQSEKLHLDQANKLMLAQENLTKLEREHGASIKRAQVYFEEARRFNAKLNSVKSTISRVSEDIVAAKKAYARTLNELEQFSEDLHINGRNLIDSQSENDQ